MSAPPVTKARGRVITGWRQVVPPKAKRRPARPEPAVTPPAAENVKRPGGAS